MSLKLRFSLTLASLFGFVVYIIITCLLVIWFSLLPQERLVLSTIAAERASIIVLFMFVLLIGLGSMLRRLFRIYTQISRLLEETKLITTANPEHRIAPADIPEVGQLANVINTFADNYQALKSDVDLRIRDACSNLEEEKDVLAALMSELTQGVVVCNIEGRVLLYNQRVRQLFSPSIEALVNSNGHANGHNNGHGHANGNGARLTATGGLIGLGRSIFSIVDRSLIAHALDQIHHQLAQGNPSPFAHFVTTMGTDRLLSAYVAPVQDSRRGVTGFVLTLEDITRRFEISYRRDELMRTLIEQTRASLASIRAAIETVIEYPHMDPARLVRFTNIIHEESLTLSYHLDQMMEDSSDYLTVQWPLEEIYGRDLVAVIRRRFEDRVGLSVQTDISDEAIWMKLDSYSVAQSLTHLMGRLYYEAGVNAVMLRLQLSGHFASLDVIWQNATIGIGTEMFQEWAEHPSISHSSSSSPLSLRDVAERHGGEVWYKFESDNRSAYVRLLLPITEPIESESWNTLGSKISRPEFYDFDLFQQFDHESELDNRSLTDLTYTVFDTETTGLNPSEGDEIIAIGAVRIVNGRLLRQEVFDQLIDPRRPMPREAIEVHGIEPHMLQGQPDIAQVLPVFHAFTEDTVLVAHNAAFDMRFLQLKEGQTGVKFTNPVMDTLLLSAIINPTQQDHSLEAIARMLGINIIGRHTALGDAIVTGEVFLKLVRLLNEQGITTLKEAREAAQKTFYARLQY